MILSLIGCSWAVLIGGAVHNIIASHMGDINGYDSLALAICALAGPIVIYGAGVHFQLYDVFNKVLTKAERAYIAG